MFRGRFIRRAMVNTRKGGLKKILKSYPEVMQAVYFNFRVK